MVLKLNFYKLIKVYIFTVKKFVRLIWLNVIIIIRRGLYTLVITRKVTQRFLDYFDGDSFRSVVVAGISLVFLNIGCIMSSWYIF